MSSSAWADVLFVVVLLAPIAGLVFAFVVAATGNVARWTIVGCAVSVLGAVVLLIAGQHPDIGRLAPDDLALAAAAGTALLAMRSRSSRPFQGVLVTAGSIFAAAGIPETVHGDRVAFALVALSAAVAVAGAWPWPRREASLVVPAALVLGLRAAPRLDGTASGRVLAVGLAVVAAGLAIGLASRWQAALVPWALVAALGPVAAIAPASRALAAGAVLVLMLDQQLAALALLPGATAVAYALADGHGWARAALALMLLTTAAGVARGSEQRLVVDRRPAEVIATCLGVWLVVRPDSWGWLHLGDLTSYTEGATFALATGLIVTLFGTLGRPPVGRSHAR
jgi:hypothetical protein